MKDDYLFSETPLDRVAERPSFLPEGEVAAPLANLVDALPRMRSLEQALDSLGQALVILCGDGEIIYASPHATKILLEEDGLLASGEAFRASLEEDHRRLSETLATLFGRDEPGASSKQEVHVCRPSGKLPYKLRINAFQDAEQALVIIHDMHANYMAWSDRLQAHFQLTPRECEVTTLLTDGYSMAEIAERMNISMQTLRQHLKHAFNKTDTHKQHELVGIVLQMLRKR